MKQYLLIILSIFLLVGCQNQEVGGETPALSEVETAVSPTQSPTSLPDPTTQPPTTPANTPAPTAKSPISNPFPKAWSTLDIDTLHEEIFIEMMRRDPQFATDLGVANKYGLGQSQLTNVSDAYLRETDNFITETLALLESIDPNSLTPLQKRSNDILIWDLRDQVRGIDFKYHEYNVNQLFSIPNDLPGFMSGLHPINTVQDAEDYISRLSQVGEQFEQVIEGLEIRAELGMLPPRFVFDRVREQLRTIRSPKAEDHEIYTSFERQLADLNLPTSEAEALQNEVIVQLNETVYPAYQKLIDTLSNLKMDATTDDGVWKLPNGEDYYAYALQHHTSTDMTADEIHELGLQEVERISGEMELLLGELGYSTKIPNGIGQIYNNAGGIQINNDQARQDVFAAYENAMSAADEIVGELFNIYPKAPLIIERVPAFRETSSPGAYYLSPPLDGSRPGIFFINAPQGGYVSMVGVPTLAFHEGVPGHHFQKAIQSELQDMPTFRRALLFGAYAEGWALYVEKLAWEYGYYDDDPHGNYGRLQSELFRAVRLVVDTGIHAKQWTRQEAIDYMSNTLGWSKNGVAAEVERYIVWPGQATSYKIGELTILRLRDEAQQTLGDNFDIAEFHTVILQNGDVPLEILEEIVREWIKEQD
ncbi:MAG: DUF885 domain-containing protein [Chloroflexi bacterium]|nr:MAG: DUF885 domain-containing protein [Chloroflexota bacterium]